MTSITSARQATSVMISSGAISCRSWRLKLEMTCNSSSIRLWSLIFGLSLRPWLFALCSLLLLLLNANLIGLTRRLTRNRIIRPNLFHDSINGFLDVPQERCRIHSDPERHHYQRQHVRPLTNIQIRQQPIFFVGDFTKEHSLIKPKHITGVQNNPECGPSGPHRIRFERSPHRQELGNENSQER